MTYWVILSSYGIHPPIVPEVYQRLLCTSQPSTTAVLQEIPTIWAKINGFCLCATAYNSQTTPKPINNIHVNTAKPGAGPDQALMTWGITATLPITATTYAAPSITTVFVFLTSGGITPTGSMILLYTTCKNRGGLVEYASCGPVAQLAQLAAKINNEHLCSGQLH